MPRGAVQCTVSQLLKQEKKNTKDTPLLTFVNAAVRKDVLVWLRANASKHFKQTLICPQVVKILILSCVLCDLAVYQIAYFNPEKVISSWYA